MVSKEQILSLIGSYGSVCMDAGAASEHGSWATYARNSKKVYEELVALLDEVFEEPKEMPNY